MKLVSEVDSNWKTIKKVVLNVNSVSTIIEKFTSISLDCSFENIAKGRCQLTVSEKKNEKNILFVHTDKALMIVNIYYEKNKIQNLINILSKKSSSKKIKINLDISESLMINKSGYLYVKDNLEINIKLVSWIIPIL
ncbi:MAG: hypothetical protein CMP34_04745 [Rickettsiales bacterium]|nr:hypothetical protein [Rickettsiales bacterium]|tara:strand:+ start:5050 stop:5460 length:411 start_codon:yes stop_codon:yes gene_type:complete